MQGGESAAGPARSSGLLSDGTWKVAPVGQERVELPGDARAPQVARRSVDGCFGDSLEPDDLASVHLLVTELVSNAVRHGGARESDPPIMHLAVAPGCVRVEVCDTGPGFEPGRPAPYGEGGYGLFLVDSVATRWGVELDDGTCVWFEFDRDEGGR